MRPIGALVAHAQEIVRRQPRVEERVFVDAQPGGGGSGQQVIVKVKYATGDAGGANNDCNFRYDLWSIDDVEFLADDKLNGATPLSPERRRLHRIEYAFGGHEGALWGFALAVEYEGDWVLLDVFGEGPAEPEDCL